MANDSTGISAPASDHDTTPNNESYFADMQGGEDAFFGPEQLAQATGTPHIVPVPKDENVIRVQVNPGEILELAPPFDAGANLLGREEHGNLAIKVGDVTVILEGFVDANAKAPVVVETSDGKPIDIAVLLASTDPNIDIQTAAGPGQGQGGQGADNTGAILAQLNGGAGLGGLNSVGAQDQTELSYKNIDNSILKEFNNEFALLSSSGSLSSGLQEPFLRDPVSQAQFTSYQDFIDQYQVQVELADKSGWADFTGTKATADNDFALYLQQTSEIKTVASPGPDATLDLYSISVHGSASGVATSGGYELTFRQADNGDTLFVYREDKPETLVMVIHILPHNPGEDFQIETILVNRLDHIDPDTGDLLDTLNFDINFNLKQNAEDPEGTPGSVIQGVIDDAPVLNDIVYYNVLHGHTTGDGLSEISGGGGNTEITHDNKGEIGYVDEDYLICGNHDDDNTPPGADKDAARGDTIGDTYLCGKLDINFGADGPACVAANNCGCDDESELTSALLAPSISPALALSTIDNAYFHTDPNNPSDPTIYIYDADGNQVMSYGNKVQVISDCIENGVEVLTAGYYPQVETDEIFASGGEGACGPSYTTVFTLTLYVDPDNTSTFQKFEFCLDEALDQNDKGLESTEVLVFPVIATDFDGDELDASIKIGVNDDAPKALDDSDTVSAYAPCSPTGFTETAIAVESFGSTSGNVILGTLGKPGLHPDMTSADQPSVVTAIAFGAKVDSDSTDGFKVDGAHGYLIMAEDGSYTYYLTDNSPSLNGKEEVFTYSITDFDGDTSSATLTINIEIGGIPSIAPAAFSSGGSEHSYQIEVATTSDYDVRDHAGSYADLNNHLTDNGGSHTLAGGGGDDRLEGNAGDDVLKGRDGDDLLFGGSNADSLDGGRGNDVLDGGDGADKMSGGRGDDTFLNIDVADLDGSNTLDGTHSIDGGKGTDTLDLSHLASFDSSQAARVENVEVLDLTGGAGTAVSLNYDAAYGITQVGGLHAFTIKGDAADSVTLSPSNGQSWTQTGTDVVGSDGALYNVYTAGAPGHTVTVSVEHDVAVATS